MAKEQENVKSTSQENGQAVATDKIVTENESVSMFRLEREKCTGRDGKEYWSYAIHGKIRGRDVKVDFVAYDQGGYEVLDIIFDIADTAELVISDGQMTNETTGEVIKFRTFEARNVDNDGVEYRYKIRLARESDKALLNMLLQQKHNV